MGIILSPHALVAGQGNDGEVDMKIRELLQAAQFVVDAKGNKKAVVVDYSLWEELLTLLEDVEDAEEIHQLREAETESVPWDEAKVELRAQGADV
jgi:hypothetical protein